MKDLIKIKEALTKIAVTENMSWKDKESQPFNCDIAKETLSLLNKHIERLGVDTQKAYVEGFCTGKEVMIANLSETPKDARTHWLNSEIKAAIETIKGE